MKKGLIGGLLIIIIILGWFIANHQDADKYEEEKQFIKEITNEYVKTESEIKGIDNESITKVAEVQ